RLTAVLTAALASILLTTLRALLTRLSALTLLLTLLLSLLLALLLALLITLLISLLLTLLSITTRGSFFHRAAQRIKIVSQLSRAIEILFRSRTIWTTRTLLRRLQAFGKVVETALDRTLITARTLLATTQRLLAFTNAIR